MLSEAQRFWNAIVGKVRQTAQDESRNAFRCERYEVTTAANGSKMGVTLPLGTREIFLPYSAEVADATVGTPVLVVWWGSMSNAKVYYYADGYKGYRGQSHSALDAYPVGSIYASVNNVSPATLFGGTWVQLKDTFLLAAGDIYAAGSTGGEATHTLTASESGQRALTIDGGGHTHVVTTKYQAMFAQGTNRNGYYGNGTGGSNTTMASIDDDTGTHSHTVEASDATSAHNNMPPYIAVYVWQRVS